MFRKLKISIGVILIALLACGWVQRNLLKTSQSERETLRMAAQNLGPPATAVEASSEEIERLREATRELPRLRNEVRQLRQQRREMEQAQAENERLRKQVESAGTAAKRQAPTAEQGFMLKDAWANAGFGTPEAAVQTFFWALSRQDAGAVAASMTRDAARAARLIDRNGQLRPEAMDAFRVIANVQALRIAGVQQAGGDQMKVNLQAAVNGETISIDVQRLGSEWKVVGF